MLEQEPTPVTKRAERGQPVSKAADGWLPRNEGDELDGDGAVRYARRRVDALSRLLVRPALTTESATNLPRRAVRREDVVGVAPR